MAEFNVNKEVTAKLRFQPEEKHGNRCRGYLVSVEVVENEIGKVTAKGDVSTWEFAGLTIPTLCFNFEQHKSSNIEKTRYFTHFEKIIGNLHSVEKGGEAIDIKSLDSFYEQMWSRVKHIHDCFASLPNYQAFGKDVEAAGKKLFAGYIAADKTAESTVKLFTTFFKAVVKAFNEGKDGKAIYKIDDKPAMCWIKLIAEYRKKQYLCFPTFVGTGFIELHRKDVQPTITFSANESIILGGSRTAAPTPPSAGEDFSDEVKKAMGLM